MTTNSPGYTTRELPFQAVHYMRFTVNYSDAAISSGEPFNAYLPTGAQILRTVVNVITAFNAGTSNVLTVGYNSGSYNNIVASADVTAGTAGAYTSTTGAALTPPTTAEQIYVKYAQTGTAATAGQAVIVIEYVPNNDQ